MTRSTLTARIAAVQTRVTLVALLMVTLGTAAAATVTLTWKSDQQLHSVLGRVVPYLAGKSPATMDFHWLTEEINEVRSPDVRVEVRDAGGRLRLAVGEGEATNGVSSGCQNYAEARACGIREKDFLLTAIRSRADDINARRYLVLALSLVAIVAGVIVALGSRVVTRRAMRPFSELAARVAGIEPGTGRRVALRTDLEEVDLLAERFDALVERFEGALEREQRFTAEASHELRTPLTVALAEIEALARGNSDGKGTARAIDALMGVSALAEALLMFARAQGRVSNERMDIVNLADVAREQIQQLRASGDAHTFSEQLPDEALVRGDERLLSRAVANLLDNASKYGDGSPIDIRAERKEGSVCLIVSNAGAQIPAASRERIFEPFFRAASEPSGVRGFGLGLPFVRAVARAHDGEVLVSPPGAARTDFTLRLPLLGWSDVAAVSVAG